MVGCISCKVNKSTAFDNRFFEIKGWSLNLFYYWMAFVLSFQYLKLEGRLGIESSLECGSLSFRLCVFCRAALQTFPNRNSQHRTGGMAIRGGFLKRAKFTHCQKPDFSRKSGIFELRANRFHMESIHLAEGERRPHSRGRFNPPIAFRAAYRSIWIRYPNNSRLYLAKSTTYEFSAIKAFGNQNPSCQCVGNG